VVAFAWSPAWDLLIVSSKSESNNRIAFRTSQILRHPPRLSTIYSPYYTLLSEYIARYLVFKLLVREGIICWKGRKEENKKISGFLHLLSHTRVISLTGALRGNFFYIFSRFFSICIAFSFFFTLLLTTFTFSFHICRSYFFFFFSSFCYEVVFL